MAPKQMPREKKACVTALYHTWIWNRNIALKMFICNQNSSNCMYFIFSTKEQKSFFTHLQIVRNAISDLLYSYIQLIYYVRVSQ